MRVRPLLFVTAGMIGAAVGGASISSAITDPDVDVGAVPMTRINGTPTATSLGIVGSASEPTRPAAVVVQTVDGLELLIGTLLAGEEPDDWFVSGIKVDFGPDGWISGAPAIDDYDGDGTDEPLLAELRGLGGRTVTLGVRYEVDDDRDDADAFTIEGRGFRDPTGAPAPWQTAPVGTEATRDDIAAAAVAAVGQGAVALDVDPELEDGWRGWDVEVRAADGRQFQVYVSLDGDVVDVRPDTD
jgi:hypothetical protein